MVRIGLLASVCSGLLILTACRQQDGDYQDSVRQTDIDRAILAGELSTGDWIENSNDNEEVVMFGLNQTEPKLSFHCNLITKQIFLEKDEYIPDQNKVKVKFITPTGSKNYQATVENHGFPALYLTFEPNDPFLDEIAAAENRFAVVPEVGKQLLVPGSPKINELFTRCS